MLKNIGYRPRVSEHATAASQAKAYEPGTTFEQGFQDIIDRKVQSGMSGKVFIQSLNEYELSVIQKSKLIADRIRVSNISEEGAENLFVKQGDDRKYVDLNNDGITEIGAGYVLVFPPPNCPDSVKDAWDETCREMSFREKMLVTGQFLGQTVSSRLSDGGKGAPSNVYGNSEADFIMLIDSIIGRLTRFPVVDTPEQRQNHGFVIESLQTFKSNISQRT